MAHNTLATTAVYIGSSVPGAGFFFDGKLDDVRVYDRALSHTEINALAIGQQAGTSVATQTLTGNPTIANDLVIASGTLAAGTSLFFVGGSWWNYGGGFTGTGTVSFTGSSPTNVIRSARQVLPGLNFTGTGTWTLADDLDIDPSKAIALTTGSLNLSTRTLRVGDINAGSGTLTATNATVVLNGNGDQTLDVGSYNNLRSRDPTETNLVGYWKLDRGIRNQRNRRLGLWEQWHAQSRQRADLDHRVPTLGFTNTAGVEFDGVDDIISATSVTNLPAANAAQTISLWVNLDDTTGTQSFVSLDNASVSGIRVGVGNALAVYKAGAINLVTTSLPSTGVWHHVAYTYDGTTDSLYLDGTVTTATGVSHNTLATTAVYIGSSVPGSGFFFDGKLDDVRIYNVALTAAQISQLAAGRYANTGGTSTYTLGANLTASGSIDIDSGGFNPSSFTATATTGLTVRNGGTLTMATSGGSVRLGERRDADHRRHVQRLEHGRDDSQQRLGQLRVHASARPRPRRRR